MSLLDIINAEIAALDSLVPVPAEPFGYGTDLSCVSDLTPDMREVDPNSPQAIGESVVRFLTTERDSIPDAPGRGRNIYRLLNRPLSADDIIAEQSGISSEVLLDDRIDSATVDLTVVGRGSISIVIRITPVDPTLGGFDLVLAVTDGETLFTLLNAGAT